jgi:tryptophan-rich sensory protein
MFYRLIIFLALNFAALAIGGLFTSKGVSSDWYAGIAKAPWTPPGWAFGAAWTTSDKRTYCTYWILPILLLA